MVRRLSAGGRGIRTTGSAARRDRFRDHPRSTSGPLRFRGKQLTSPEGPGVRIRFAPAAGLENVNVWPSASWRLALARSNYSNMCEAGHTSLAAQAGISAGRNARHSYRMAVASRHMQHGVPMRDLVADWKKWSRAERVLAVMGTLLMVALPLGLLMTG
jgi:hypothetical protein